MRGGTHPEPGDAAFRPSWAQRPCRRGAGAGLQGASLSFPAPAPQLRPAPRNNHSAPSLPAPWKAARDPFVLKSETANSHPPPPPSPSQPDCHQDSPYTQTHLSPWSQDQVRLSHCGSVLLGPETTPPTPRAQPHCLGPAERTCPYLAKLSRHPGTTEGCERDPRKPW